MQTAKVLTRGQITLPRSIRRAAGLTPGDTLTLEVTGPGTIELKVLPRLTLAEALERYRADGPVDLTALRKEWEEAAAQEVLRELDQ